MNDEEEAVVRFTIASLTNHAALLSSLLGGPRRRKRVRVHFVNAVIAELKTQLETCPMALVQKIQVTVPGDSRFGYIISGLAFANAAGGVADPQPSTEQVAAASDNLDVLPTVRYLGDGRAHFTTNDASPPGSIANASFSVDGNRKDDDGVVEVTIASDRLMAINLEGATIVEATEEVV